MALFLACVAGSLHGQRSPVGPREFVIGRDPNSDLFLAEPTASRRHARLYIHGDSVILEDLGSTHGTWLNRKRISAPVPVTPNDLISIGATELRLEGLIDKTLTQPVQAPQWPFVAEGQNARLEVFPDRVRIVRHPGFSNLLLHGVKGDKEILIRSLSGIQFKPLTKWTVGYIQFTFNGGLEAKKGITEAVADENTVSFRPGQEGPFDHAKALIDRLIQEAHTAAPASPADELMKLADLHRQGILSVDEFARAKARLGF